MANFVRSPLFVMTALACIALALLIGNQPGSIEQEVGHATPLKTPEQWLVDYNCSANLKTQGGLLTHIGDKLRADRCRFRDPSSWVYKYLDELQQGQFEPLVLEPSLDQRLANLIYLVTPTRVHRGDMDVLKFNSGDAEQDKANKKLVAGPQVNHLLCEEHLNMMLAQSDELQSKLDEARRHNGTKLLEIGERHIHLARVLDSFGRYGSGHFSGKYHSIGSYEQCMSSQLLFDHNGGRGGGRSKVKTRFCWAKFTTDRHLERALKTRRRRPDETGENLFRSGVCIPATCHSASFDDQKLFKQMEKLANRHLKLPQSIYLNENFQLQSVFCPVDDDSQMARLPPSGKYLLALLALLVIYKMYKVALDRYAVHPSGHEAIKHRATVTERVNVDLLNVIKVISTMLMVLTHACGMVSSYSSNLVSASPMAENDPIIMSIMTNADSLVDIFFVISGLLLTFTFMKRLDRLDSRDYSSKRLAREWLRFTVNRYLKLMPLLCILVWFKKSIFPRLAPGGPLWDYGLNKDAGIGFCVQKQSWWTLIMPINLDQAHLARQCLPVAWTVSVDLLFALILPPLIYLLMMQAQIFVPAIASLILWLTYTSYKAFSDTDKLTFWDLWEVRPFSTILLSTSLSHLHTNPWRRLSACLVGLIAGFFVYLYSSVPEFKWHKTFTGTATIGATIALALQSISIIYVFKIRNVIDPYHMLLLPHLLSTSRLVYTIAVAIILVRAVTDWSSILTKHLVGPMQIWLAFSKLGYIIGLIHWDILTYDSSTITSDIIFGKREIFALFFRAYPMSVILSMAIHKLVHNPLDELVRRNIVANI